MKEKLDENWNINAKWSGSMPLSKRKNVDKNKNKFEKQSICASENE
jgi:hypothetical protein